MVFISQSIDWITGTPLTNPDWAGGPYTLIENYIPPAEGETDLPESVDKPATGEPETVVIDGVEYRRA
jgi:hypothetical protein